MKIKTKFNLISVVVCIVMIMGLTGCNGSGSSKLSESSVSTQKVKNQLSENSATACGVEGEKMGAQSIEAKGPYAIK